MLSLGAVESTRSNGGTSILRSTKLTLVVAMVLPLLATVGRAAASLTEVHVAGPGAIAAWRYVAPDRCAWRNTFLTVVSEAVKSQGGAGGTDAAVWLFQASGDKCHGVIGHEWATADGGAPIPAGAFQADRFITTATLDAAVPVTDQITGASAVMTVHLSWSGHGDLARSNAGTQFHDGSCTFTLNSTGTDRNAVAWGTITDGAEEYAGSPSPEAALDALNAGSVTVGCDRSSSSVDFEVGNPVRGKAATAVFNDTAIDACTHVYADVSAYDMAFDPSAGAPHDMEVYLDAMSYDACQDRPLSEYRTGFFGAVLPDSVLHIDDDLATAHLDATVPVVDFISGTYTTLDVNLAWTASSPADRFTEGSHSDASGCTTVEHAQGVVRGANISGTFTDGVTNFAWPSGGGQLESIRSEGTISRGC